MPPSQLQAAVHAALKAWYDPPTDPSPLSPLRLFQQNQVQGAANARQATNEILLTALEFLRDEHHREADFLRKRFLDRVAMHKIANELNISEATAYRLQSQALERLTTFIHLQESQARTAHQTSLTRRLEPPSYVELIGVAAYQKQLLDRLTTPGPPWLLSIEGLGGIGKTSLADTLTRQLIPTGHFTGIAWVSAKQREFHFGAGLQATQEPVLAVDTLVQSLLEQVVAEDTPLPPSPQAKMALLTQTMRAAPYFIVIDNLETAPDYETLLPTLRRLVNPTKFLLTSRHSLLAQSDVFCLTLPELSRPDAVTLLKQEADLRNITALAAATPAQLTDIYETVGGNPLALKLVAGQMNLLALDSVLDNLKQARGKKIDDLYTHIYWQAWQLLTPLSQQVLLAMPLAQAGDREQLAAINRLDLAALDGALEQLIALSLVDVQGDLTDRRYRIHRLTETFLLTEVTKWQTP